MGEQCPRSKEGWSDHKDSVRVWAELRVSTEAGSLAQGLRVQAKQGHPCGGR